MKKPSVSSPNLPYTSTIANFYRDQGAVVNPSLASGGIAQGPSTVTSMFAPASPATSKLQPGTLLGSTARST